LVLAALNLFVPIYFVIMFKDGHQSMNPTLALTFERLGPYRASADVILSNKAAQQVWQLGTDHELGMQGCQLDDGSVLVSRVQVLWHGVGTRSLLRFPSAESRSGLEQGRVEVDTADVRLLSALPHQCAQLPTEVHFASKSEKPLDPKEVEELVDQFSRAIERAPKDWRLATVQLHGHADSMPLVKDGNVELGLARAKIVGAELAKQLEKLGIAGRDSVNFDAQSSASRSGRSGTCPLKGDRASLEECHAKSRRVEVRLIFKPPLPKVDKTPQA
jgi:outer membrane protein OmpA-like peptidoglycan-associated protein